MKTLDALDEVGLTRRTVVIRTADHGEVSFKSERNCEAYRHPAAVAEHAALRLQVLACRLTCNAALTNTPT